MFRSTYLDDGDACHECQVCGAEMWFAERLKGVKKNEMPQFGICCCNGKIIVPLLRRPPKELEELFFNKHSMQSKKNLKNIRTYNNMFCFTSMGGRIDHSINSRGGGPYSFVLSDQNHHFIGSLLPPQGNPPVYAQLYIYDTENEISNRMSTARSELNQFIVDGYSMVESDRLDYIRKHQKELRVDLYSGITDALTRGETDPSSTGDELFYHLLSQWRMIHDSKLSRCYGHLCMGWLSRYIYHIYMQPHVAEITRHCDQDGLKPCDRPEILSRIFNPKLHKLMRTLKDQKIFGSIKVDVYTVEFQKRGLPHAHIILWLSESDKIRSSFEVDQLISQRYQINLKTPNRWCTVMLIRNIDQAAGMCNGTRLQISQLGKNVIKAKALNGTSIGEEILIHRMDMNPS
ncbi:hypothetical protein K1719_024101 [Acacia pycnantha]|nr:hypothetical protein K1719_024101 [Acacia pycnantha]